MAAMAQVGDGNVVVKGCKRANYDTVIIVAKPAMATACDGNGVVMGGTALIVSSGHPQLKLVMAVLLSRVAGGS